MGDLKIPNVQVRHHAKLGRMRFLEHTCKAEHWSFLRFAHKNNKDGSMQGINVGS